MAVSVESLLTGLYILLIMVVAYYFYMYYYPGAKSEPISEHLVGMGVAVAVIGTLSAFMLEYTGLNKMFCKYNDYGSSSVSTQ